MTSAEGGLVAAMSEELAARIEFRRAYGFQNDYVSRVVGLNGKLSEIHAALACLTVGDVERVVEARATKAARYRQNLSRVPGLDFQEHLAGCRSAYKDFAILCPDRRDALADALEREGIQTKKYFRPLHGLAAFKAFRSAGDDLEDTAAVAERILCLPMFNDLADSDIDRVCERVADFYGHA